MLIEGYMKNTVKILILALSFAGVSTLILIFLNSILKPPMSVDYSNQFLPPMESFINELERKDNMSLRELDEKYFVFTERTKVYRDNKLFNSSDFSSVTKNFVTAYNPDYASACLSYFKSTCWDGNTLNDMNNRLSQLRGLSQEIFRNDQKLSTVSRVLDDYKSAVDLSKKKWTNLEGSTINRTLTNSYMAKPFLCNNNCLSEQMEASMKKQGRTHYNYLVQRVGMLGTYYEMENTRYDALSSAVLDDLKEYKENAERVYGETLDVDRLKQDAIDYYSRATDYYQAIQKNNYSY